MCIEFAIDPNGIDAINVIDILDHEEEEVVEKEVKVVEDEEEDKEDYYDCGFISRTAQSNVSKTATVAETAAVAEWLLHDNVNMQLLNFCFKIWFIPYGTGFKEGKHSGP